MYNYITPSHNAMYCIEEHSCEFGSMKYYAYCGFGGILSCGLTHTAVVPLDVVKCRVQVKYSFPLSPSLSYLVVCIVSPQTLELLIVKSRIACHRTRLQQYFIY